MTTDLEGVRKGEVRYMPWGEDRYSYGSTPTTMRYTGQRQESSIGLYFYNARYYDPSLGRFIQADSVLPNPGDPVAFDRYAYVRNSPVKLIDPSGHGYCDSNNATDEGTDCKNTLDDFFVTYGITLVGDWTREDKYTMLEEFGRINGTFAKYIPGDAAEVFQKVFGKLTITLKTSGGLGCGRTYNGFECGNGTKGSLDDFSQKGLITHELGHVFNARIANNGGYTPYEILGKSTLTDFDGSHITGYDPATEVFRRTNLGYLGSTYPYQQHPLNTDNGDTAGEDFADMFMNYVMGTFDYQSSAGVLRGLWMQGYMESWIINSGGR